MTGKLLLFITISGLFLGIFFRVVHPQADPFSDRFINTEDEGLHSYAARNYYLYNSWNKDSLSYGAIMPVYPRLQVAGLYVFDLHNYGFRAVSIVSSTLTIAILGGFLYVVWGTLPSAVAVLLLSLNYFSIAISRSALPESTMVLFSLVTFIACYMTLKSSRKYVMWGSITALCFMLAFFTKQSGAGILGVIVISWLYDFVQTKNVKKYLHITVGFMFILSICMLLYAVHIWAPNQDIWYANYKATIGGNRPRLALFVPSYAITQLRLVVVSPFWTYMPTLIGGVIAALYFHLNKRRSYEISIASLAALWLVLFLVHMFSMPDKYARFLISAIVPIIIIVASLFRRKRVKDMSTIYGNLYITVIGLCVGADIVLNIWWGYNSFVLQPKYTFLNASHTLYKLVGNAPGIYPVHWIINEPFAAMSTYVMPISDSSFRTFFKQYGTPHFVSLVDPQIEDYKIRAPTFYKNLQYIKKIENYHIFRFRQNSR
jgi:4-amino-4-deoxy-L-arabinose transferase-like glycosyltransferase